MELLIYRDWLGEKQLVGKLSRDETRSVSFEYDAEFVRHFSAGLGISERIPVVPYRYGQEEIAPFFQGLLPEGEVLGNLAQFFQVARNDWFSLIEALGSESIGALTFASPDVPLNGGDCYEKVTDDAARALRANPSKEAARVASSTRLSLAGAQSKVAWMLPEGLSPQGASLTDWNIPREGAASTHIVKISRSGEEDLARNELACSRLASSCGIECAPVFEIPQIPGAIAVERYDRKWVDCAEGRKVVRLHQEDFCQAFGFQPFYKYQPQGVEADYVEFSADAISDISRNPNTDKLEFAKRLVFDYAVGNSDAHLKNSSFLYDDEWRSRRLAPMYDVTCIPLSGYSTKMPFDIGKHRELEDIDEHDIFQVAMSADIDLERFEKAVIEVIDGIDNPSMSDMNDSQCEMTDRIVENSQSRLDVLKRFAGVA